MIGVLDQGQVGALMLLDLSAAFDTVDHDILTSVLRRRFAVDGPTLDWLSDFLSGRSQIVRVGTSVSDAATPLCILVYRRVLSSTQSCSLNMPRMSASFLTGCVITCLLISKHVILQGFKHGRPDNVPEIVSALQDRATNVSAWCAVKRLQLNAEKTEVLWFGTATNLRKISPDVSSIRVDSTVVTPTTVVRNLGVMLDAELSVREDVSRTAQSCFYHLRRLHSVRRKLGRDVTA